jgi:metal-responsive CopG/Arc/MetJ family transcriptional regulator
MKREVYRTKVDTPDKLLDLIMDVTASIKERPDALRQATRHVLTRVAKCMAVDGGIFGNVLLWVNCTNFFT